MRPEKRKRLEINPSQGGLASIGDALSGLDLGPLPAEPPAPSPIEPVRRAEVPASRPAAAATPSPVEPRAPKRLGRVILRRETAHRGGRTVIVIHEFPPTFTQSRLEDLARNLRHALGTGGTVRNRTIEMQGDQPAKIRAFLEKMGFQVAGVS